jgi:hypothetical protein
VTSRNGFTSAIKDGNGDIVCVGIAINEFGFNAGHAAKFDSQTGETIWYHTYNHAPADEAIANEELWDIVQAPDSGYVMAGWLSQTFLQGFNSQDVWMLRVDNDGCLEPGCLLVGIDEQVIGLQEVMSVYPNPVRSDGLINIHFEQKAGIEMPYTNESSSLVLLDMQGKEVYREQLKPQGSQASFTHVIQTHGLATGYYTLHWTSGSQWFDSINVVAE